MRIRAHPGAFPLGLAVAFAACAGAQQAETPSASPEAADEGRLVAALRSKIPLEPPGLEGDPYETWRGHEPPGAPAGTLCGVRFEQDGTHYRLATFPGRTEASAARFSVTHTGACGTCSTLQDLAVYRAHRDLTAPARRCGMRLIASHAINCLEELGFSHACALTWFYDARNTRRECAGTCVLSWLEHEPPTTGPDRQLNDCLRCDEERSGPVFRAIAGRTRRNSGILSSIPRPEADVAPVVHDYVLDAPAAAGAGAATPAR